MIKYIRSTLKIILALTIILFVFEIGWMNGANHMQIEANYSGASAAYVDLMILQNEKNPKYLIAKNGLESLKAGNDLKQSYVILGLISKYLIYTYGTKDTTKSSMKELFDEIINSAQQGDAPEPVSDLNH
jgi:hypothetical protein